MTIGKCGHAVICLECTYKFLVITKNKRCAYCNEDVDKVVVFNQTHDRVPDLTQDNELTEFKEGIFYSTDECRIECLKLENKQCFIDKCKAYFLNLNQFYEHLKKAHNRYMCSLCVENRALLIKEQKVYRREEYDRHMCFGDYDDENNLIFLHPYCGFCRKNFFNDDSLLDHLRKDHFNCNLCDPKTHKLTYYNKFENLNIHYDSSHHLCKHPDCSGASVFKTRFELESHFAKEHEKNKKKPFSNLLFTEQEAQTEDKKITDKEGFDFTNSVN